MAAGGEAPPQSDVSQRGADGLSDVALTYVLLTCPCLPGPPAPRIAAQPVRVGLARLFARRNPGKNLDERIAVAADRRTLDRNMAPAEIANLHRLARRCARRPGRLRHQTDAQSGAHLPRGLQVRDLGMSALLNGSPPAVRDLPSSFAPVKPGYVARP